MDNERHAIEEGNRTKRVTPVDSLVSLPRSLTAENGAKDLLIGEFHEYTKISCPECDDDEDWVDGCQTCHGNGWITRQVPVQWDTIKRIYDKIVEHFAN